MKGFPGDGRFLDRNAIGFFDADRELERVDGIEAEAVGAEEDGLGLNFVRRDAEHAVVDQKFSHIIEVDLGHT